MMRRKRKMATRMTASSRNRRIRRPYSLGKRYSGNWSFA